MNDLHRTVGGWIRRYAPGALRSFHAILARLGVAPVAFENYWTIECVGPDGQLKWVDRFANLVTNAGLDDILDKYYKGSGYSAAHFVGITDGTPTFAAGDTMASHAGWTEADEYAEATRRSLTLGSVSGQSVDNTASKASFSINGSITAGGAFLTTSSTKGGSTGTLIAGAAFSGGDRALLNGDTLLVSVTLTAASA